MNDVTTVEMYFRSLSEWKRRWLRPCSRCIYCIVDGMICCRFELDLIGEAITNRDATSTNVTMWLWSGEEGGRMGPIVSLDIVWPTVDVSVGECRCGEAATWPVAHAEHIIIVF